MIDRGYDANRVRQRLAGGGLNLPLFEAQRMGIAVPQELSICGIDNHELGTETNPALTTIALPTQDLRRIAAAQVLAALAGEPIARQSLLPFALLVRGTTARVTTK